MRNKKNLVQKTLTLAAIASMGTTFAIASPSFASANQINTSGEEHGVLAAENTPTSMNKNAVGITDVQSELNKIGTYYYTNEIAGTKIESWPTLTFKAKPDSVETKLDFNITGTLNKLNYDTTTVDYVTIGELDNTKTPTEQTLTTSSYTKSIQETVSTATQNGFKFGGAGDLLLKVPLLLNNIKINAEFNSSTTKTQTTSETKTITLPSQNIKVPPGKKYRAVVVFEQLNFWGDVSFTGEGINPMTTIKGTATYWAPNGMGAWKEYTWNKYTALFWKELTDAQKKDLNGIEFIYYPNTGGVKIKAQGTGKVEGVMGSKIDVDILDVTNPSKHELVETRSYH